MGITTFSLFISCQDNDKIKLFAFFKWMDFMLLK